MIFWVSVFIITLADTLTFVGVLLIMKLLFGCSLRYGKKEIAISATASGIFHVIVVGLLFPMNEDANFILMILLFLVCTIWLSEDKKIRNVLMLIPAVLVYVEWCGVITLLERLTGLDKYVLLEISGSQITPLYFFQDISLLVILFVLYLKVDKKLLEIRLTVGEGIFLTFFCVFTPFLKWTFEQLEKYFQRYTYTLAWSAFILVLNFAVAYGIAYRKRARYYKSISENYKEHFENEYAYFRDYKKQQKDTAKFRHDFNNHMLVIQDMLHEGAYEKAEAYFRTITEKQGISVQAGLGDSRILTGNEMADILLAAKTGEMNKAKIHLTVEGSLTPLSVLAPVDLCILLSNLIDNAIEANLKCKKERYIRICTGKSNALFMLTIENPVHKAVVMEQGFPVSTKSEKDKHGFGLRNVRDIIVKYQGEMQFDTDVNLFSVKVILPLENHLSQD
ncbi:MAG: GHKL domain-containing protein [Coprococcus sp.]|nr:GHKL domain-containing protein [Coprococcus sp.]